MYLLVPGKYKVPHIAICQMKAMHLEKAFLARLL
jgi:hypothetical protein